MKQLTNKAEHKNRLLDQINEWQDLIEQYERLIEQNRKTIKSLGLDDEEGLV